MKEVNGLKLDCPPSENRSVSQALLDAAFGVAGDDLSDLSSDDGSEYALPISPIVDCATAQCALGAGAGASRNYLSVSDDNEACKSRDESPRPSSLPLSEYSDDKSAVKRRETPHAPKKSQKSKEVFPNINAQALPQPYHISSQEHAVMTNAQQPIPGYTSVIRMRVQITYFWARFHTKPNGQAVQQC